VTQSQITQSKVDGVFRGVVGHAFETFDNVRYVVVADELHAFGFEIQNLFQNLIECLQTGVEIDFRRQTLVVDVVSRAKFTVIAHDDDYTLFTFTYPKKDI
jgi:hypothetical protein